MSEWDVTLDTEEGRTAVKAAEQIIAEARARGCAIAKKVNGKHVLDREPFDPQTNENQILAPIVGG